MYETTTAVDAPSAMLQALVETSFETVKLLGLKSTGTRIAKNLGCPADPLEALSRLELGKANYEISSGPKGGRLVVLKQCPFAAALQRLDAWSQDAIHMVQRFNESPRGGAALHPICITHLSAREAYGGVNLGCRSTSTGKMAVSVQPLLDEAGLTAEQVREKLDGMACLYWLTK